MSTLSDDVELRADAAVRDVESTEAWDRADQRIRTAAAAIYVMRRRAANYRLVLETIAVIETKLCDLIDEWHEMRDHEATLGRAFARAAHDAAWAQDALRRAA